MRPSGLPADTNNGHSEIALNAVQVSVDPCAVRVVAVHYNLVRLIPLVFAGPPQRGQRRREPGWRLLTCETAPEGRQGHGQVLARPEGGSYTVAPQR